MQQWHYSTAAWVFTSPTLAEGTLYFGGFDKHFHALDAATGVPRWRRRFGSVIASAPAVDAARVYFGTLFEPAVYALDRHSGEMVWRFATQGGVHSAPALHEGVLLLTDLGGWLHALDPASGAALWQFDAGAPLTGSPAVSEGGVLVVFNERGQVFALDTVDGVVLWEAELGAPAVGTSPLIRSGRVFIGDFAGTVHAFDLDTGARLWRHETGGWIHAALSADARQLYVASTTGQVTALALADGALRWQMQTAGELYASPALMGAHLLVPSLDGWLYALDSGSGREAWRFSLLDPDQRAALGPEGFKSLVASFGFLGEDVAGSVDRMTHAAVLTSPVPANGVIYIGSFDGRLYALAAVESPCSRRQTERASGALQGQASPCRLPAAGSHGAREGS